MVVICRLPLRKVNFFCHKGIGFDGITFGFASVLNSQVLAFLERLYVLKTYYMSSLESDAVLVVHAPKGTKFYYLSPSFFFFFFSLKPFIFFMFYTHFFCGNDP